MIENLSSWAKTIVLAVIVVSILEMLLPNNKTKKYVKMVMGIFILYNIISPIIVNKGALSFDEIDINKYANTTINEIEVNQESMDKRLEELYIKEIEKDVKTKVEKQGFKVNLCDVKGKITQSKEETGITKIKLKVEKSEENKNENSSNSEGNQKENSTEKNLTESKNVNIENKIVTEIQKIKKVNITEEKNQNNSSEKEDKKVSKEDIQNLKIFLIKEYEVNEKCLEIN